jgi:hypothetical protein
MPNYHRFTCLFLTGVCVTLLLVACTQTIQLTEGEEKIVVWGAFNSKSKPIVYLYSSRPINGVDTLAQFLNGASVSLYEDQIFKCQCFELDSGKYECPVFLTQGKFYALEISALHFDTVHTAPDTLPPPISLDSITKSMINLNVEGHGIVRYFVRGGLVKQKLIGVRTQFDAVTVPNGGSVGTVFTCNFIPNFNAFDYMFQDVSCYDTLDFLKSIAPH